jgi:DNA-binding GntR family transcriptional regulator
MSDPVRQVSDLLRLMLLEQHHDGAAAEFDEVQLMRDFHCPRWVVRAALQGLSEQRLLRRARGIGTSPTTRHFTMTTLLPAHGVGLDEHLGISGLHPRLLSWDWIAAPQVVAHHLDGVDAGDRILRIDFVSMLSGSPLGVVTDYVRETEGQHLDKATFTADFYSLLDRSGIRMQSCAFAFQAVSIDAATARHLDVLAGDPALRFEQIIRNYDGEVFDLALSTHRHDFRFSFDNISRL